MQPSRRRLIRLASAVLVGGAVVGCGAQKPPVETATTEATVTGTVTVYGKTPKQGRVIFDPANHLRRDATQREAPIEPDGTYTITTMIGQNMIRIESPETLNDRMLSDFDLYYDVQTGENQYNIELPPSS